MEETTKETLNSVDVDSKTRYLLQAFLRNKTKYVEIYTDSFYTNGAVDDYKMQTEVKDKLSSIIAAGHLGTVDDLAQYTVNVCVHDSSTGESVNSAAWFAKEFKKEFLQAKINLLKKPDDYNESENPKWESLSPSDKWLVYNSSEISNGLNKVIKYIAGIFNYFSRRK